MRTRAALITAAPLVTVILFGWLANPGLAQEQPKAETPPPADTPSVLPRPDFHIPGNVSRKGRSLDQNHSWQGLVCVFPDLRAGAGRR